MKKIALFGGSFNPVHNGHIKMARTILASQIVDEIWFIPCKEHALDKQIIPIENRLEMLSLAISGEKGMEVSDIEKNMPGKSYTANTIKKLKSEFDHEFYFIIGADNLTQMEKWRYLDYLQKNVSFIVVKRPGSILPEKTQWIFFG